MAMAASLKSLPFPIDELAWDKLAVVAKHLKVSKAEAFTIMHHVLGPPPNPLPDSWLHIYIYICIYIYIFIIYIHIIYNIIYIYIEMIYTDLGEFDLFVHMLCI